MDEVISKRMAIEVIKEQYVEQYENKDPFDDGWNAGVDASREVVEKLTSTEPDGTCCGCRYERFGSKTCDMCSRFYADRYEVKQDDQLN